MRTWRAQKLPEPPWIENAQAWDLFQLEQVPVTRNQHIGMACQRFTQDDGIVRVSDGNGRNLRRRLTEPSRGAHQCNDLASRLRKNTDLPGQGSHQLLDDRWRNQELMLGQDQAEDIGA